MTIAGVETDLGEPIILTQAMTDLDGLVCEVEASIKNQLITKEHIAGLAEEANDILDGYKYAARDGE
jgi:hypothetical protein